MKAILDGFRFDTDKAQLIGQASSNLSQSDFGWWQAGLYVSPRSRVFFLAGEGGPMTRFARKAPGGGIMGGKRIIRIPENDAFAWACEYLCQSDIESCPEFEKRLLRGESPPLPRASGGCAARRAVRTASGTGTGSGL